MKLKSPSTFDGSGPAESLVLKDDPIQNLQQYDEAWHAITVFSHDLRAHVGIAAVAVEQLLATHLNSAQREYLETLRATTECLLVMGNNFLDFNKLQQGGLSISEQLLSPHKILTALERSFQFRAEDKPVRVKVIIDSNVPQVVLGDKMRLQQVLFNLLDNAVKFTDTGFVTIAAQVSESKQSDRIVLEFRVMDTGPGIAPAQINTIFEPFRQLHNGSKKEGAGLGLSLVKAIVEQQNGRIRVESKVGEGTSFFVTLPFQRVSNRELAASAEIKTKQTDVSLVGMDVLLVEDNPFGKKLYSRILKSWSCNVTTASTAAEVIEYTANHNYDAILMDVNLPGADGIALAKSIRAIEDHPNQKTPIIAFSAYQLSAEQAQVFDATVSKTSSVHDIRAALENFAGSAAEHPLIDLSNLLSFCDGDKRFAAEMIEMFLQDSPEALRQLHTSVRAADWRWTYQLVHRLKTNLHTLGMPELEKLAEDIEQEVSVYPVEGQAVVQLTEQLLAQMKIADHALRHELEIMNH